MSSIRRVVTGLVASAGLLLAGAAAVPVASAEEPRLRTFVAHLSSENEVSPNECLAGVESGANGVAVIQIDETTGEIRYRVVATNLPGTIALTPGAHIHVGAAGVNGPITFHFELTGLSTGLVAAGTDTDPDLAKLLLANPDDYYVNVHTTTCPRGAVRGQLG